jgi:hypothetical protein
LAATLTCAGDPAVAVPSLTTSVAAAPETMATVDVSARMIPATSLTVAW